MRISASPPPSVLSKPLRIRSRELMLSESSSWSSTADNILCPDGSSVARDIKAARGDCCPLVSETSRHAHHRERLVHLRLQKTKNPSEFVLRMTFCLEPRKMETWGDCSRGPGFRLLSPQVREKSCSTRQRCVGTCAPLSPSSETEASTEKREYFSVTPMFPP